MITNTAATADSPLACPPKNGLRKDRRGRQKIKSWIIDILYKFFQFDLNTKLSGIIFSSIYEKWTIVFTSNIWAFKLMSKAAICFKRWLKFYSARTSLGSGGQKWPSRNFVRKQGLAFCCSSARSVARSTFGYEQPFATFARIRKLRRSFQEISRQPCPEFTSGLLLFFQEKRR